MAEASFEKESADAGDSLWMSQLASGLWDADASLAKTLVQLRVLVRDGVTTSHAVYGGNVRKAIEAVARAASMASLPLNEREEALLVAFLLADGPASRRVVTEAAAQLSAALMTRMQSADLKATLGL
jgi:Ca-activated chloride channel family protein